MMTFGCCTNMHNLMKSEPQKGHQFNTISEALLLKKCMSDANHSTMTECTSTNNNFCSGTLENSNRNKFKNSQNEQDSGTLKSDFLQSLLEYTKAIQNGSLERNQALNFGCNLVDGQSATRATEIGAESSMNTISNTNSSKIDIELHSSESIALDNEVSFLD